MKLNKYAKVFCALLLLLLSNNVYSMEYNAAPHPINYNKLNNKSINEIIQQNIELQEQLQSLNKQVKDMQEELKREKEDKIREENFKKVLRSNVCEPQQYKPIQSYYKYSYENNKEICDLCNSYSGSVIRSNEQTCTDVIYLNNSYEFYDALRSMVPNIRRYYDIATLYKNNIYYGKYHNYCAIFDERVNSQMIPNNEQWINYLESLSKECPIYNTKYDSIRSKIPVLLKVKKQLKEKLDKYQELIEEIKVFDPIRKIILDLHNKINNLQNTKKYEAILNIEQEIQKLMNTAYDEEKKLKNELDKISK